MSADDKADDNCNEWQINLSPALELHNLGGGGGGG